MAMHVVRIKALGIPQESREAFALLAGKGLIEKSLADRMMAMVGFRNVAVHDYQKLNLDIVRHIIEDRLGDFLKFSEKLVKGGAAPAVSGI